MVNFRTNRTNFSRFWLPGIPGNSLCVCDFVSVGHGGTGGGAILAIIGIFRSRNRDNVVGFRDFVSGGHVETGGGNFSEFFTFYLF